MGYWTVPDEALDSPAAMAPWARLAIDCALRNRKPCRAAPPRIAPVAGGQVVSECRTWDEGAGHQ